MTALYRLLLNVALLSSHGLVHTFLWKAFTSRHTTNTAPPRRSMVLQSGYGIADSYRWHEEAFEIELTVRVPKDTKASDIIFKPSMRSIDMRLRQRTSRDNDAILPEIQETILVDGNRTLRGRVNLDGTYWVISDKEKEKDYREVTITIEKMIKTPKDDFEIVEYDWKGIFVNDKDEVKESKYDEPEVLNVREYSKQLGVDIDNINMSMVDKTMFSSGMNISQSTMDELTKSGMVQEITQQADGSEYTIDEQGEAQQYSTFGDIASKDEIQKATATTRTKIPFIDTESPWNSAVPVTVDRATNQTIVQQTRKMTRAAFAADSAKVDDKEASTEIKESNAKDPIDTLTVERIKEILKSQGLKTTGNKQELQERLRQHVNGLLQGKQNE